MPAAVVGAGIGAVGSVAGGIASGKGASKAAKIQAQAQREQTAALQAMYGQNVARMTPTFDRGEAAQARIQALLGLNGGDSADAQKILAETPGYQFAVSQALKGVNANAYASGMGNSGAAMKALQDRAGNLATQNYNTVVGQLSSVADRGVNAMTGIVQQGNQTTSQQNAVTQNGADAASANAVYQGNNLANILKGIAGAGANAFGSSYGGGTGEAIKNAFAAKPPMTTPGYGDHHYGNVK